MINLTLAEKAEGHDDYRRLLLAQLNHTKAMLEDYTNLDGRGYGEGQMPHEWGSVDSFDYMSSALELSAFMLNAVYDDPEGCLAQLAERNDDGYTNIEMDYACDGVAPEVAKYFEGGETNGGA